VNYRANGKQTWYVAFEYKKQKAPDNQTLYYFSAMPTGLEPVTCGVLFSIQNIVGLNFNTKRTVFFGTDFSELSPIQHIMSKISLTLRNRNGNVYVVYNHKDKKFRVSTRVSVAAKSK
jgi:hypothetical protein